MAQGLRTKTERVLQIIPEDVAGTLSAANAPILLVNTTHEWQENDNYDNFRQSGYTADEYNAILERECNIPIDFVPYYNLLDAQLLQFIMNTPSGADDVTASNKRTRIWKWLQTGRVNRRTCTVEEGRVDAARRATYGLIPEASIESVRGNNGKCRGKYKIIAQKPQEPVAMTGRAAQNEIQTLVTSATNGYAGGPVAIAALNGGTAQTITPGTDNLAAIQTKITAAVNKPNGDIVVTGTSLATIAGNSIADPTTAPAQNGGSSTATWSSPSGIYKIGYTYTNNTGETNISPLSSLTLTNGSPTPPFGAPALPANATGLRWYMSDGAGSNILRYSTNSSTIMSNAMPAGSAAQPPTSNTSGTTGTPAALNLSIAYSGASVANAAQPLLTSSTVGVTIGRTQFGAAGGTLTGVAPLPIEPQHWKFSRAANFADLGLPSASLGTVEKMTFDLSGLVEPKYFHNNQDTYTQHVDGETPNAVISLLLPTDDGSDHCSVMQTGAKQYISAPQWFRLQAICPDGIHVLTIEFYGSIKENIPYSFAGNVEEREFKFSLLRNPTGDFNLRITTVIAA